MGSAKNPKQPIVTDSTGVRRYKENKIVMHLLDIGPFDMNGLALLPGISDDDRSQFAQLTGYSVSGHGGLSYTQDEDDWSDVAMEDGRENNGTSMMVSAPEFTEAFSKSIEDSKAEDTPGVVQELSQTLYEIKLFTERARVLSEELK
ncbi:MAG: hypothetical protein L3J47_00625 [Sulfurovum sp.]|nr:hypothetical protein [Sulfurovum sp.]